MESLESSPGSPAVPETVDEFAPGVTHAAAWCGTTSDTKMTRAMACASITRQRGRRPLAIWAVLGTMVAKVVRRRQLAGDYVEIVTALAHLGRPGPERHGSPELTLNGEIHPAGQDIVLGRLEFNRLLLVTLGEHNRGRT